MRFSIKPPVAATLSALFILPLTARSESDLEGTAVAIPAVTGQITSYAGEDDGADRFGVRFPEPRFVLNGDGTVTDRLTGLMWLRQSCIFYDVCNRDWAFTFTLIDYLNHYEDDTSRFLAAFREEYTARYGDWRVPNIREVESLVDLGRASPGLWLQEQGFEIGPEVLWSSTSSVVGSTGKWTVGLANGEVGTWNRSWQGYLLAVRGPLPGVWPAPVLVTGQTASYEERNQDDGALRVGVVPPEPRFIDQGDGTVLDKLTGLIWLQDANRFGVLTWSEAMAAARDLEFAGITDWKLPTRRELWSLTSFDESLDPLPAGHPFINANAGSYWSSTTVAGNPGKAWSQSLSGNARPADKESAPDEFWLRNPLWPVAHPAGYPEALTPPPMLDWGDAPDSYATTGAKNGASHVPHPLVRLGLEVDGEIDGQPSPDAWGDDVDAAVDDEDGVHFRGSLEAGLLCRVDVATPWPLFTWLDIWIDYDGDGKFRHPPLLPGEVNEYVCNDIVDWEGKGSYLLPLPVNSIHFRVPDVVKTGPSFARFRVSATGGLGPSGPGGVGDVEDYRIFIGPQQFTKVSLEDGQVVLTWSGAVMLEQAPTPTGPWSVVPDAASPHHVAPSGGAGFFRLVLP